MDTSRVIICSPADVLLFELSPDEIWACDESIEINGPHTLEIVTTRVLTKEQRVLVFDEAEHAHEYVVASEDREHASGSIPYGTYKCAWSLQHDARLWKVDTDVGIVTPVVASYALDAALSGTERWVRGSVTLVTTGGAEMHNMSGWEAFETIIATWGGEIDAEVVVGPTGVTARRVMLYAQMGNQTATRRFDYERDVESIQRHVLQDDVACRIIPLGKSEKNEYGVEHSVDIKSVNSGVEWLQNDDSAAIYRLAGPNGSYEYPIMYVENTEMETAADLLAWGQSVLEEYTVPKVEYEMEVTYLYHKSYNPFGVSLGDVIQCVDHGFGDTPLRLEARVTGMTIDRLDRSRSTVKVSNVRENRSLTSALAGISSLVNEIAIVSGGITEYLNNLLDNINKEINARGGFVYITDGQGIRTYSDVVQDPLTGYEAGYVTEMKGGSLRFAHEKENGEWKWTTVITEQGYLGLAATIARITSGFIGSASGGNYWNLDTGEVRLTTATHVGSGTIQDIIDAANATITNVDVEYAQGTSATTAPTTGWGTNPPAWEAGKYIWSRTATTTGTGASASTSYSTPVMISGRDGSNGSSGTGIVTIREQYYLSSSNSTQTGGSWSYNQPEWSTGKHIWTRSEITWDTNPQTTTYTDPILAAALTQANAGIAALTSRFTRSEIFSLLTNNGTWQGFFTDTNTGEYYINASYIAAGVFGDISGKSYWDTADGTVVIVNATKNQWNREDSLKFGTISFVDASGWINTKTTQQTARGVLVGEAYEPENPQTQPVQRTAKIMLIPSLPVSTGTSSECVSAIMSDKPLKFMAQFNRLSSSAVPSACFALSRNAIEMNMVYASGSVSKGLIVKDGSVQICAVRTDYTSNYGNNVITSTYSLSVGNSSVDTNVELNVHGNFEVYKSGTTKVTIGEDSSSRYVDTKIYGSLNVQDGLSVSGSKSRVVSTENYDDRLLYCYETASPFFGDIGSGRLGDDGLCYVELDPIFAETAQVDCKYQVFLQKCGQGDLWVEEKAATHFIVSGTAGLEFDWEVKARQVSLGDPRLESNDIVDTLNNILKTPTPDDCYEGELNTADYMQDVFSGVYSEDTDLVDWEYYPY